jgi:hypothetical protein
MDLIGWLQDGTKVGVSQRSNGLLIYQKIKIVQ